MGRKCSIFGCKSGYTSNKKKIKVYKFPIDAKRKSSWIEAIPHELGQVTPGMGVCAIHFRDCKEYKINGIKQASEARR